MAGIMVPLVPFWVLLGGFDTLFGGFNTRDDVLDVIDLQRGLVGKRNRMFC